LPKLFSVTKKAGFSRFFYRFFRCNVAVFCSYGVNSLLLPRKSKTQLGTWLVLLFMFGASVAQANAKELVWGTAFHTEPQPIVDDLDTSRNFVNHLLFDPLFLSDQQGRIGLGLVTKWKIISPTQVQFELRDGVKFHSGNLLSAEDVEWTFQQINQQANLHTLFAPIKSLRAINRLQFEVQTFRPFSQLIQRLSLVFPVDKQFYLAQQKAENGSHVVQISGTGAYKLSRYVPGIVTEFSVNPDYWRKREGNVSSIKVVPIKQVEMRMASLFSRDVDIIDHVPDSYVDLLNKDKQLSVIQTRGLKWLAIELNQHHPALAKRRVRQAINLAIDNARLAEGLGPYAMASTQLSIPGQAGYNEELLPRYNLLLAHQLLQQAGYAEGFSLSMAIPNSLFDEQSKVVSQLVSMLDRVNIRLVPSWLDEADYQANVSQCLSDLVLTRRQKDAGNVLSIARAMYLNDEQDEPKQATRCRVYQNEEVSELILAAEQELDGEQRAVIIRELEKVMYQQAAFVPLYWQRKIWATNRRLDINSLNRNSLFPLFEHLQILD